MSALDPKALAAIRDRAAVILGEIEANSAAERQAPCSWVRSGADDERSDDAPTARCNFFNRNGFIHIPAFASEGEAIGMKKQMVDLAGGWEPVAKTSVFRTDEGQTKAQGSDDYFLSSASRVHFFAEKDATNEDGSLKAEFSDNKVRESCAALFVDLEEFLL